MSKLRDKLEDGFEKIAKVPGIPDGTGPHGRGLGPGKGRADGTGIAAARDLKDLIALDREGAPQLTEKESKMYELTKKLQALDSSYPGAGEMMRDYLLELGLIEKPFAV